MTDALPGIRVELCAYSFQDGLQRVKSECLEALTSGTWLDRFPSESV